MDVLVIGGTGPTGPHVVQGLVDRGHRVTILHTGRHETDELPAERIVPHLHADPFDTSSFTAALHGRTFDLAFVMYGRLRMVVEHLVGRVGRLVTIGGVPVYPGFADEDERFPSGMKLGADEDDAYAPLGTHAAVAALSSGAGRFDKIARIVDSEALVFRLHPTATHFRFPYLYGPRQVVPREWSIVKRALDGRRELVVADGGRTLHTSAYTENAARAVLLAADRLDASAGRAYNVGDDDQLTIRQIAEIVADELGHRFDLVNLPAEAARPAYCTLQHHSTQHRLVDTARLRHDLGYTDIVAAPDALRRTVRWQAEHLPAQHDRLTRVLQDPFDYPAEDRLVALQRRFVADCAAVTFATEPGYSVAYYGPRPNPGDRPGRRR
jgi:nucleoside-diphosphate-sugar epimerase